MKNKTKGIIWLVIGIGSLPVTLTLYAIVSFITQSVVSSQASTATGNGLGVVEVPVYLTLLKAGLGLAGFASLILLPLGIIFGIVYLTKKGEKAEKSSVDKKDSHSEEGDHEE